MEYRERGDWKGEKSRDRWSIHRSLQYPVGLPDRVWPWTVDHPGLWQGKYVPGIWMRNIVLQNRMMMSDEKLKSSRTYRELFMVICFAILVFSLGKGTCIAAPVKKPLSIIEGSALDMWHDIQTYCIICWIQLWKSHTLYEPLIKRRCYGEMSQTVPTLLLTALSLRCQEPNGYDKQTF